MRIWAHRGSHGPGGPVENTLEAFEQAVSDGAEGIELDVHLSVDGVPVVFHDETLDRLTPDVDPRRIDAVSVAELLALPLASGARMPTLAAVLDALLGRIPLNIELKDPAGVEATAALLKGRAVDGVMLSSFSADAIAAGARFLPAVPRAWIYEGVAGPWGYAPHRPPLARLKQIEATHWHPEHVLIHPEHVDAAHAAGLWVNVWTVNSPTVARRMARCGVDGIMTDRPAWMRAALARPAT